MFKIIGFKTGNYVISDTWNNSIPWNPLEGKTQNKKWNPEL